MKYLIIGGSSGIGEAIVQQLQNEGHEIIFTFKDHPKENGHFYDAQSADDFAFIPDELDGLVYCPGSIQLKPFRSFKEEDFKQDYELNVIGLVNTIQACLPAFKKASYPSIVMFSTVAVQMGFPYHSLVASSKGAVEGLCKALAAEFAPKIRVNAIAPSLTDTPLAEKLLSSEEKKAANVARHPLKRVGESADLASMACFLLSEKSSWITGQIMKVDGGASSLKV
ncbi:MAG: SDR family oxidoreductase [Bacteroidota bacterium]